MYTFATLCLILQALTLSGTDLLEKCISGVLKQHFEPKNLVISLNINFRIRYPVVRLQFKEVSNLWKYGRVNIYIMDVGDGLETALEYLSSFHNFNPRAKFILIANTTEEDIFRTVSGFYMSRVALIDSQSLNVSTYFPYESRNVQEPDTTPISLGPCQDNFQNPDLFGKAMPKTWDNSLVRISYKPYEPYVLSPYDTLKGIEIFILETTRKYFNFRTAYYLNNASYYDVKEPETYYAAYGNLMEHEADISIGALYLKDMEHMDFDVTHSYLQDSFFWVVPKAAALPKWERIVLAFRWRIWTSLLLSFISFPVLYAVWLRRQNLEFPSWLLFYLFGVLVEIASKVPQQYFVRGLLGTWIFYCLIISTAFKSQMMNLLIGVSYGSDYKTLEDIVNSDLIINLPSSDANLYDNDGSSLDQYVYEHNVKCPEILDCINRIAVKRDSASIAFGRYISFRSPDYLDASGRPSIVQLEEKLFVMSIHMIISKGFPMFEQINKLLMELEATGIVAYDYEYMEYIMNTRIMTKQKLKQTNASNLDTMALPFVIWMIGTAVSLLVFLVEILWTKVKKNKTYLMILKKLGPKKQGIVKRHRISVLENHFTIRINGKEELF